MISWPLLLLVVSLWLVACGGGAGSGDDSTTAGPSGTGSGGTADTTSSTATLTAPAAGATVSGAVTISATAADDVGVAGVQFKVDGVNLGAEIAAAPYTMTFNTTAAVNGPHTIVAVARDAAGNTTSSSPVTVTVSNAPPPAPDTTVPSVPTGLTATTLSSSQITLTWKASTDNVGVAGYRVFRNGTQVAIVTSTQFQNNGLAASTTYTFTAQAYDAAGNSSAASAAASATTLVAGAQTALGALAASMQPGTWAALATNNINQAFGEISGNTATGDILPYADGMVWNPLTRQTFFIGSDHNYNPSSYISLRFVSYSDATNTWSIMPQPSWFTAGIGHAYDHNAINPSNADFYYLNYSSYDFRKYNIASGSWTQLPAPPINIYPPLSSIAYFPELGGLFYVTDNGGAFLFNEGKQQWSSIGKVSGMNYHNFSEYNPVHNVVVFGGGNGSRKMYKLSSSGQITALKDAPIELSMPWMKFTVDPVSGDYLVFTYGKQFYVYNVVTDAWQLRNDAVPIWNTDGQDVMHVSAIPISTYGVVMFVTCDGPKCRVNLYKHASM